MSAFSKRFPRRVRIHGGECGAVARALHHEAKVRTSPAVFEIVSITTKERKQMSKMTFKRISLAVVVALGFGVMGALPASQAAPLGETLTLSSSTATAFIGETATVTATSTWGTTMSAVLTDSNVVKATCAGPSGVSCPALQYTTYPTSDTANTQVIGTYPRWISGFYTETAATVGGSVRAPISVKAVNFSTAGTYTYTFYTEYGAAATLSTVSATWTVTVSARDVATSSVNSFIVPVNSTLGGGLAVFEGYRTTFLSSRESTSITADKGTAATPAAVAYAAFTVKNAAGDTITAGPTTLANVGDAVAVANASGTVLQDTLTVSITGPGLLSVPNIASTKAKSVTLNANNRATLASTGLAGVQGETLVVWSDGTAGTGTVTVVKGSTTLKTFTVTFTGDPASATSLSLSDSSIAIGGTSTFSGTVKDSAGNTLTSGTMYVWVSDTSVVTGGSSTTASQNLQAAAGARPYGYTTATTVTSSKFTVTLTGVETGTVSVTFTDSWTVAASSFTSTAVTLTVKGTASKLTVAFDKSSYAPDEKAIITITATDLAGRGTGTVPTLQVSSNKSLGNSGNIIGGTAYSTTSNTSATTTTFTSYAPGGVEDGVETRVVYMPSTGGTVNFSITMTPFVNSVDKGSPVTYTATATVVDPVQDAQTAAIAAAQKAAVAAAEAATAAADAATDAALQAIDAANAATDAANLGAEAADAATVAAEEAKDAADAATAAVEALATQVATLMAALQAQVRSLANTVAKIAKKVKA